MRSRPIERALAGAALALAAFAAHAGVTVTDAWARATVPGQQASAAYMTLTSSEDAKLVAVSSPAAKSTQVHTSMMMSGVMHMHEVEALELPAGRPVELKPGGHHVMLMGLAKPLEPGGQVALRLTIRDAKGRSSTLDVKASVRPLVP
ncbi:MAG TPA: copper chaperone PCu(A)C [Usitatibacter sp.]|nr:copper chaperone PCu(A)C [Usitatibacter sp.]